MGNIGDPPSPESKQGRLLGIGDPTVQQQLDQHTSTSSERKFTWLPRKVLSIVSQLVVAPFLALAIGVDRLANIFGSPFMNKMFFQGGGGANRTFNVSLGIEKFLTDIGLEFGPRPGI